MVDGSPADPKSYVTLMVKKMRQCLNQHRFRNIDLEATYPVKPLACNTPLKPSKKAPG